MEKTHIDKARFDYFFRKINDFVYNTNRRDIDTLFNIYKENKYRLQYPADCDRHLMSEIYDDETKVLNRVPSKKVFIWYIYDIICESIFSSNWFQGISNNDINYSYYPGVWSKFDPVNQKITVFITENPLGFTLFNIDESNSICDELRNSINFGKLMYANGAELDKDTLLWKLGDDYNGFNKDVMLFEFSSHIYQYEIDLVDLIEYQDRKTLFNHVN